MNKTIILSIPNDGTANNYILNSLVDRNCNIFYTDHRANLQHSKNLVTSIAKMEKIDILMVAHFAIGETYDSRFLKMYKINNPSVTFVALFFDSIFAGKLCYESDEFINLMLSYDYVFVVSREIEKKLKDLGINAIYFKVGFDTHIKQYDIEEKDKDIDILFVGQVGANVVHTKRLELLDSLCLDYKNVKIFGPIYRATDNILKCHAKRNTVNDVEFMRLISRSKIVINMSDWGDFHQVDGYSMKVYSVLAAGGFLIHNEIEELVKDFGDAIIYFNEYEDLKEKIDKYLTLDFERKNISLRGQKIVLENFTWNHSIDFIFKAIYGK